MKKIVLLFTMMTLFASIAQAQLNVTSKTEKPIKVCQSNSMMGNAELYKSNDIYYIYTRSTNQYDDVKLFFIGDSKESALQTLKDLEKLFETTAKGELISITDHNKQKISLYKSFKKQFQIEFEVQAGIRCLALDNINDFISALSSTNAVKSEQETDEKYDWMNDPNYQ